MSRDRLPPLLSLRVFEAAARHDSFREAADELCVTPGAVSQQIRLLEEHVGLPLFVRDGRRVSLSEAGRVAAPVLREAFLRMHDAVRLMKASNRKGRVTVSAPPSFAAKWLLPRLERFTASRPDVDVWVSADMRPVDLAAEDIDLAVRYGKGEYEELQSELLLSETVIPVCSPGLYEAAPIKTPESLRHHVLLHDLDDTDASCPDWGMWLKANGVMDVEAGRGPRFNESHLVIEAAAAGRGVALAKRAIAEADLRSGRLIALFQGAEQPIRFAYHLVWPQSRELGAAQTAFIEWLREEARGERLHAAAQTLAERPVFAAEAI